MKRVKEGFFREHPEWAMTEGCSGCKEFEGEDLAYDSRTKYNKNQQKQWLEQQMQEKKWLKEQQKQEEQAYAIQTLQINRMRGMLEDDFNKKKQQIKESQKEENQMLSKQKKDQEEQDRQSKLKYEQDEVNLTKTRGLKKPFPGQG